MTEFSNSSDINYDFDYYNAIYQVSKEYIRQIYQLRKGKMMLLFW